MFAKFVSQKLVHHFWKSNFAVSKWGSGCIPDAGWLMAGSSTAYYSPQKLRYPLKMMIGRCISFQSLSFFRERVNFPGCIWVVQGSSSKDLITFPDVPLKVDHWSPKWEKIHRANRDLFCNSPFSGFHVESIIDGLQTSLFFWGITGFLSTFFLLGISSRKKKVPSYNTLRLLKETGLVETTTKSTRRKHENRCTSQ